MVIEPSFFAIETINAFVWIADPRGQVTLSDYLLRSDLFSTIKINARASLLQASKLCICRSVYNILENEPGGSSPIIEFEQFKERFFKICEEHRSTGRALAFAFILFGEQHAEMYNMLENQNYWQALNTLSGRWLTVFTFRVSPKKRPSPLANVSHWLTNSKGSG